MPFWLKTTSPHPAASSPMLKSAAMIVDAVDTGEEALELARLYDYDVVVLDLVLPDMEGYEVVRRSAARVETPILILGPGPAAGQGEGLWHGCRRLHH